MLRFIYVILMNLFRAPYIIPKMRKWADHPEKYSEEERYKLVRHVIYLMKRSGKIKTVAYGEENLQKKVDMLCIRIIRVNMMLLVS